MPTKPTRSSRNPKLKKSPPPPRVEVVSQSGTELPVNTVTIQEDADGIYLIRVEVQLPVNAIFSRNSYITSGFKPTENL